MVKRELIRSFDKKILIQYTHLEQTPGPQINAGTPNKRKYVVNSTSGRRIRPFCQCLYIGLSHEQKLLSQLVPDGLFGAPRYKIACFNKCKKTLNFLRPVQNRRQSIVLYCLV